MPTIARMRTSVACLSKLRFSGEASALLKLLEAGDPNRQAKLKKVRRALARLEQNPRHPGLHSHQYESFPVDTAVKVWDSYVENQAPGAWRIFWRYGPDEEHGSRPVITVWRLGRTLRTGLAPNESQSLTGPKS
jgi:hypothetical protein